MTTDLFRGEKVRLAAMDTEQLTNLFDRAARDSELSRQMSTGPARLHSKKARKKFIEEELAEIKPHVFPFAIRTLEDDRLIGDIDLYINHWSHAEAFVGIGIAERDYQGKGYGTDAMRIALRYAFTELNLARVSLDVFEYNPRAIRSYEKAGFKIEGRLRSLLNRAGQRYDMIFMGILRDEWLETQTQP